MRTSDQPPQERVKTADQSSKQVRNEDWDLGWQLEKTLISFKSKTFQLYKPHFLH